MENTFTAAFLDELEKLGVRAISKPKGGLVRTFLGKLRGRSPGVKPPHEYVGDPSSPRQTKMTQFDLKKMYETSKAGKQPIRTTPGGAPMSASKADVSASLRTRAAMR